MPQLDTVTFNHQLVVVTASLTAIYLTLSLVIMPSIFSNTLTRKQYFALAKSLIPRYFVVNLLNSYREDRLLSLFLSSFETEFYKNLKFQQEIISQTESIRMLGETLDSHFRDELLEVELESKAFQKLL